MSLKKLLFRIFVPALLVGISGSATARKTVDLFIGSYTDSGSAGIYVYRFDPESGEATYASDTEGILPNPSFVTGSADGTRLYAVSETAGLDAAAAAFAFDRQTGKLTLLNRQPTHGAAPCHLRISPEGTYAITANYLGGNATLFPIAADGSLEPAIRTIQFTGSGPAPQQEQAHPHCTLYSPDEAWLLINDLGSDRIHRFRVVPTPQSTNGESPYLEASGSVSTEPGSGPRHSVFHPNGKFLYLLNELSGTLSVFGYDDGILTLCGTEASDTTPGHGGKGSADLHFSPDGRFLYCSNRLQEDGIVIFRVDETTGLPTRVGYQSTEPHPRNFTLSPDGRFLLSANRDGNCVQIFAVDRQTGLLTDTGKRIELPHPTCVVFGKQIIKRASKIKINIWRLFSR